MGGRRGQLVELSDRQYYVRLVNEAVSSGARKKKACELLGVSIRTLQRWVKGDAVQSDKRPSASRPEPKNKLTELETARIVAVCNQADYADLPPSQIVPVLADNGEYIASESSFYRVLKRKNMLNHRGRSKPKKPYAKPTSFTAYNPNEVWTWDITYLATRVVGKYYYLYMFIDIYSRKIVGWEVYESETAEYASELVERIVLSEQCVNKNLVLHSDNGGPMKSYTLKAKLENLGIASSKSRPRVSNDNPYSESLFRTLKYCPSWPSHGFESLDDARVWVLKFVGWYNNKHRHSSIRFVTPNQRHNGQDKEILEKRQALYRCKQEKAPGRWSGKTRNWDVQGPVELNPEQNKDAA